jgi:hypothetical protein
VLTASFIALVVEALNACIAYNGIALYTIVIASFSYSFKAASFL